MIDSFLGKTVEIKIDRPIGYIHRKDSYSIVYPVNYGYIPGIFADDGEEFDVYLLGVNEPVDEYTAKIIAVIHRYNDIEDKLVAAPKEMKFTVKEINKAVHFQEQYFETEVEVIE